VRSWFEPDSVMEFGFEPASNQLRTSSEPASVMEFGFNFLDYIDFIFSFHVCIIITATSVPVRTVLNCVFTTFITEFCDDDELVLETQCRCQ